MVIAVIFHTVGLDTIGRFRESYPTKRRAPTGLGPPPVIGRCRLARETKWARADDPEIRRNELKSK